MPQEHQQNHLASFKITSSFFQVKGPSTAASATSSSAVVWHSCTAWAQPAGRAALWESTMWRAFGAPPLCSGAASLHCQPDPPALLLILTLILTLPTACTSSPGCFSARPCPLWELSPATGTRPALLSGLGYHGAAGLSLLPCTAPAPSPGAQTPLKGSQVPRQLDFLCFHTQKHLQAFMRRLSPILKFRSAEFNELHLKE